MRVLVVFAHPVKESFSGHLVEIVRNSLSAAGHDVDFIDLYAEAFSPALTEEERSSYYVADKPREPTIERYIHQLQAAESVVLVFPVWNYGFPAMLKGYFDRVYVTGVAFNVEGSSFIPTLRHIRKVAVVTTYGGDRLRTALMGDPPRATLSPNAVVHVWHQKTSRLSGALWHGRSNVRKAEIFFAACRQVLLFVLALEKMIVSRPLMDVLSDMSQLVNWETRPRNDMRAALAPARDLALRLDLLPYSTRFVQVTGTKGKGSVCSLIEHALLEAGFTTGRYASPHIIRINERISVNCEPVGDEVLSDALDATLHVRNRAVSEATDAVNATWFDVFTVASLKISATVEWTGRQWRLG